jgi:hypothetical protein
MNRTTLIVLAAAAAVAVGAGGYWLGKNPSAIATASSDNQPPAITDHQQSAAGHWEMQAQFEGPLKDTVVQRWRDPATGVLCYIYLPIIVQHSQPLQNGMVHYGSNGTGSISCVPAKS